MNIPDLKIPRVVIVGCGFGGLQLAKSLRKARVQIVMFDTNNYHTFQPLLYQVATSGLEPDSIAYPIRKIFKKQKNFLFRWGKVENIIPEKNIIQTTVGELAYDYLVIATGEPEFSTTSPIFTRLPSMDCVAIYIMAFMPCSHALENIVASFRGTKVVSFLIYDKNIVNNLYILFFILFRK